MLISFERNFLILMLLFQPSLIHQKKGKDKVMDEKLGWEGTELTYEDYPTLIIMVPMLITLSSKKVLQMSVFSKKLPILCFLLRPLCYKKY